jgi:gas vesicle protein
MTDYQNYGYRPLETSSNIGLALAFLFIGLSAGAAVALLLAPKTGKQMRRTLKRKYEDAREVFEDLSDQASDMIEKGTEYAESMKSRVAPIGKAINKARR